MTAFLIPPSPESPEPTMNAMRSIVTKIQNGNEEVTKFDLRELKNALATLDHSDTTVPYLNRKFIKTCPTNPPTMVRFIGMVQDMLNPEFYVSKVHGVHTKYRDFHASNEIDTDEMLLEERQPLIIVPIPFCSKWFSNGIVPQITKNDGVAVSGSQTGNSNKKRSYRELSCDMNTGNSEEASTVRKLQTELSEGATIEASVDRGSLDIDWWPEGCMGSDVDQCPVLAKMYYDEDNHDVSRLQLNDLVEIVGMICMDPNGASFRGQRDCLSNDGMDNSCFTSDQDNFFDDFVDLPPPSILPRLHVLQYNKIDLDIKAYETLNDVTPICKRNLEDDERSMCIQTFSEVLFDGDHIAAEALLMVLMSSAERNKQDQKPIQIPSGGTLGCASVNFVFPNSASCDIMCRRLSSLLELICPVQATTNLSLTALNGKEIPSQYSTDPSNYFISAPIKNRTRLIPSVMQLPKSSCFIINQGMMKGILMDNAQRTLNALSKMTQNHTTTYQFDGMMEIDFECDLRIIVLSTSPVKAKSSTTTSMRPLPCSLTVHLKGTQPKITDVGESEGIIPMTVAVRIRQYITRCRGRRKTNIGLPREVLSQAQHDFVERRKGNRHHLQNHGITPVSNASKITENDFHRWLTLTRLQKRSRLGVSHDFLHEQGSCVAEIKDWKASLSLDDSIRHAMLCNEE